jgi:hypothetical protein
MAGDIIGTTVLTGLSIHSTPGSGITTPNPTVPVLQMYGGSQLKVDSGASVIYSSGATVSFAGAMISLRTVGNLASLSSLAATDPNNGILAVWQGASGLSLVLRSGNTIYTIGASAVSAAAP